MWQCKRCQSKVEDSFEVCWNCLASKDGTAELDSKSADREHVVPISSDEIGTVAGNEQQRTILCLRCQCPLDFVGTKAFHEGTRWGILGDLGELFVKKERFDVYCCPRCGRVEFFVDGIGEQLRSM